MTDHRRVPCCPGRVLTEHSFTVPLDHARPDGEQITVFAREVAAPDGGDRPFLVFLQGGPGQRGAAADPRPTSPGWLDRALRDYRVLLLDQRGTGRSTPVGALPGLTAAAAGRPPRAVPGRLDRRRLRAASGSSSASTAGACSASRSAASARCATCRWRRDALREAFFTGGLPPVGRPVDDVYARRRRRSPSATERYYARYPGDRDRLRALLEPPTPARCGCPTASGHRRAGCRQLGNGLGMSDGAEQLHYLLELDPGSPAFRHDLAAALPFAAATRSTP